MLSNESDLILALAILPSSSIFGYETFINILPHLQIFSRTVVMYGWKEKKEERTCNQTAKAQCHHRWSPHLGQHFVSVSVSAAFLDFPHRPMYRVFYQSRPILRLHLVTFLPSTKKVDINW